MAAAHEVRDIETSERRLLPPSTPSVTKPADMDYAGGEAIFVGDRHGRPLLRYRTVLGAELVLEAVETPLGEHNPGDFVLVEKDPGRWRLCVVLP